MRLIGLEGDDTLTRHISIIGIRSSRWHDREGYTLYSKDIDTGYILEPSFVDANSEFGKMITTHLDQISVVANLCNIDDGRMIIAPGIDLSEAL